MHMNIKYNKCTIDYKKKKKKMKSINFLLINKGALFQFCNKTEHIFYYGDQFKKRPSKIAHSHLAKRMVVLAVHQRFWKIGQQMSNYSYLMFIFYQSYTTITSGVQIYLVYTRDFVLPVVIASSYQRALFLNSIAS